MEPNLLWIILLILHVGHIYLWSGPTTIIFRRQKLLISSSQKELPTILCFFILLFTFPYWGILLLVTGCQTIFFRIFHLYSTSSISICLAYLLSGQPVILVSSIQFLRSMLWKSATLSTLCFHNQIFKMTFHISMEIFIYKGCWVLRRAAFF